MLLFFFLLVCFREAARAETLEIKYRKMMEDNNVEKVRAVKTTSCLDCLVHLKMAYSV